MDRCSGRFIFNYHFRVDNFSLICVKLLIREYLKFAFRKKCYLRYDEMFVCIVHIFVDIL